MDLYRGRPGGGPHISITIMKLEPVLAWEREARSSSKHLATMVKICLNKFRQFLDSGRNSKHLGAILNIWEQF